MSEPAFARKTLPQAEPAKSPVIPREGVGEMDAAARLEILMRAVEGPASRLTVARPSRAQWMGRARLALACAALAVIVGGVAGTLSSL